MTPSPNNAPRCSTISPRDFSKNKSGSHEAEPRDLFSPQSHAFHARIASAENTLPKKTTALLSGRAVDSFSIQLGMGFGLIGERSKFIIVPGQVSECTLAAADSLNARPSRSDKEWERRLQPSNSHLRSTVP